MINNIKTLGVFSFVCLIPLLVGCQEPESTEIPKFADYAAGTERKGVFFDYIRPLVDAENQKVAVIRARLLSINKNSELSNDEGLWLLAIAKRYRMEEFELDDFSQRRELINRVDVAPASLVLSQAAAESGWGTSRFATQGNNYFGQWCFKKGCGLVPASRQSGKAHEVAVFVTPQHSIERYLLNLNSFSAYKQLRAIRAKLRAQGVEPTGVELADGLIRYSERGAPYVDEIKSLIRSNKLE
ncbi:MAG: Bax protein [Flavobacteriales bacterium]|jgi:Bax protein